MSDEIFTLHNNLFDTGARSVNMPDTVPDGGSDSNFWLFAFEGMTVKMIIGILFSFFQFPVLFPRAGLWGILPPPVSRI